MRLIKELTWDIYEPHPDGAELFQRICDQGKLNEFENYLTDCCAEDDGETVREIDVDDILRFEEDDVVNALGLDMSDGDDEASLRKLDQSVFDDPDCPSDATCAAVDSDGEAYWYNCDPADLSTYPTGWTWKAGLIVPTYIGNFDASDWENSKIVREKKNV